jgi:hypothetical protein
MVAGTARKLIRMAVRPRRGPLREPRMRLPSTQDHGCLRIVILLAAPVVRMQRQPRSRRRGGPRKRYGRVAIRRHIQRSRFLCKRAPSGTSEATRTTIGGLPGLLPPLHSSGSTWIQSRMTRIQTPLSRIAGVGRKRRVGLLPGLDWRCGEPVSSGIAPPMNGRIKTASMTLFPMDGAARWIMRQTAELCWIR